MTSAPYDVSVLIVNYNTAALTLACVESVLKQRDVRLEVIVVDNDSQDQSVDLLQSRLGSRITLIANKNNRGFGSANNQAFHVSQGRYLFMLNPDAAFLTEYDLLHAIQFMDRDPRIGLAGTRIINSQQMPQITAFTHYPKQWKSSVDFSSLPGDYASVLGASMIARREAFASVKGFDEDFFLYAEETDICLRLRKLGYHIGYCEQVTVQHVGGASEAPQPREHVVRRKKSAKYLFFTKHYTAADVKNIARHDYQLAMWRMIILRLKKLFVGLTSQEAVRYMRHRVTCEISKRYCRDDNF